MGNDLEFALQVMVLGFSVVLVTLISLYFLLIIFSRVFHREEKQQATPALAAQSAVQAVIAKEQGPPQAVIAAAMGAVYAYLQEQAPGYLTGRFSISVQPPGGNGGNNWVMNGRKRLHSGRVEIEQIRRKKQRENI